MKYVYRKDTKKVLCPIDEHNTIEGLYRHYPKEFRDNLGIIETEKQIASDSLYYIDGEIVSLNTEEEMFFNKYGRIPTNDDIYTNKMLNKLKPSLEEVRKAEQTIEILTLIQEVMK